MSDKPDCYKCIHGRNLAGDSHLRCNNHNAKVVGNPTGVRRGWFMWPLNFDPTWLVSCDGFSDNEADDKPKTNFFDVEGNSLHYSKALQLQMNLTNLVAFLLEPEQVEKWGWVECKEMPCSADDCMGDVCGKNTQFCDCKGKIKHPARLYVEGLK